VRIEALVRKPQPHENRTLPAEARNSLAVLDNDQTPVSPDILAWVSAMMLQVPQERRGSARAFSQAAAAAAWLGALLERNTASVVSTCDLAGTAPLAWSTRRTATRR
jgi:hypothetical protein